MQYPNYLILRISFIHTMHTQKTGSRLTIYTHVGGQFRARKSTNHNIDFRISLCLSENSQMVDNQKNKGNLLLQTSKSEKRKCPRNLDLWPNGCNMDVFIFSKSENSHISNFKLKISYLNLLILGTFNFC